MSDATWTADPLTADRRELFDLLDADAAGIDEHVHPLSDAQYRMWFADRFEGANVLFNFPSALHFGTRMDVGVLRLAFQHVARRHLVLTARMEERDGHAVQVFDPEATVRIPVVDLEGLPAAAREAVVERLLGAESARQFDLSHGPLLHLLQLRCAADSSYLLLNMHHIVSDGWSSAIFARELLECFQAVEEARAPALPPLDLQYSDFVYWQQERLAQPALRDSLAWWQDRLRQLAPLRLPLDRPRSRDRSIDGAAISRPLPAALSSAVQALAQAQRCTLFTVMLAAFKVLLSRYDTGTDICVGSSVASRPLPELESLIGLFVNQLALRTDLGGNPGFAEVLRRVSTTTLEALAHQEVPFDRVVAQVAPARAPGVSPLFQVLFLLNNMPTHDVEGGVRVPMRAIDISSRASRFDLSLTLEVRNGVLAAEWRYRKDIFDAATIATMAARYETVLHQVTRDPSLRIDDIEILTTEEKQTRAQEMLKRQESRADRFKGVRRKAIDLATLTLVSEQAPAERHPLMLTPAVAGVDLAEWAEGRREYLESRLHRHGSLLFRDFGTTTIEQFERFARAVCPDLVGDYGDLPKESKGEKVYKSTPYPASKPILFHNESSHTHRWPMKQFFSCLVVAESGGETPIVDCRALYRGLRPQLAERFARRGLLYVRNFVDGLDVSWREFFKTDDREAVSAHLRRLGTEFAWKGADNLRIAQRAPAVARHPRTGEPVFFNQIQLHHIGCMEPNERDSLRLLFEESDLPRNVYYGDGARIEDEVIEEINALYASTAISFPWQAGDILMVDNMLTAHGRSPFRGERKVIVAMGEMVNSADITA